MANEIVQVDVLWLWIVVCTVSQYAHPLYTSLQMSVDGLPSAGTWMAIPD
jgi:hypothetical protein